MIDSRFSDFLDGYHSAAQLAFVPAQQLSPGSGCGMSHPIRGSAGSVHQEPLGRCPSSTPPALLSVTGLGSCPAKVKS